MAERRETLNDRYIRFSYRNITGWVALQRFPGWYQDSFEMEADGLEDSDFAIRNENGKPVMRWQDNDSIYVDRKP